MFPKVIRHHSRTLLLVCALAGIACRASRDAFRMNLAMTPHEKYASSLEAAGLAETALGKEWLAAADTVLRNPLAITLPFHEAGYYDRSEARAVAWRFALREGQRVSVALTHDGLPAQLFLDLFQLSSDSTHPFVRRASAARDSGLTHEVRDSGTYVLRLQPELLRSGRYDVTITTTPMLAFPVQGRGNGAVQSFYGAERDAGAREHKGVDIFAPRGTPALAAVDGIVRSTSPNNLGGNVVWLADARHGQVLYYAHLDRIAVQEGTRVRVGDTLGFVGNTGNARTTNPHLHFGIYRSGRGAIDPYPYIKLVTARPAPIRADTQTLGKRGTVRKSSAPLHIAPASASATVRTLPRDTPLRIMGAASTWYRVQLADGIAGYLPFTDVAEQRDTTNRPDVAPTRELLRPGAR